MVYKMNIFNKNLMLLAAFIFASNVNAGLISKDYDGVVGGITFDSSSNIEWLDLNFTQSMTVLEYQEFLASSTDGWQMANFSLVSDLFSTFGVISDVNSDWGNVSDYGTFQLYRNVSDSFKDIVSSLGMLGEVMSSSSQFIGIRGFYGDTFENALSQFAMYHSNTVGVISTGKLLSLANGKESTAFFTYREAKQVAPMNVSPRNTKVSEPNPIYLLLLALSALIITRKSYCGK